MLRRRSRGFSLLEVVVATLIVGIVMVAALESLGAYIRGQTHVADESRAWLLAQDLMSEILDAKYQEPDDPPLFGPEAGENAGDRATYDDVDDYHGWSASPPEYKDGTPMSNLSGWRRRITIEQISAADLTTPVASDQGLRRITVEVSRDGQALVTMVTLRAKAWQEPPFD
jgi:prepilin-type N-terminal cleavage/methylation domain-containing protein